MVSYDPPVPYFFGCAARLMEFKLLNHQGSNPGGLNHWITREVPCNSPLGQRQQSWELHLGTRERRGFLD